MAVKALLRALLILALIISAHLIRPFSIKSVTQHLLYSAKSFRFAVPVQMRDNFDHANNLAINLSNVLFETSKGNQEASGCVIADFAFTQAKAQPGCNICKSVQKQIPRKSASTKQLNGALRITDPTILSNLVAVDRLDDIRMIELPPMLMFEASGFKYNSLFTRRLCPAEIHSNTVRSVETALKVWKIEFEKREADLRDHIACAENEVKNWIVERSGDGRISISVSKCDVQVDESSGDSDDER